MMSRNSKGCIVAFILGVLLNGIGTIIMVLREVWQSKKYGFPVETDDVVRYSIAGAIGSIINTTMILLF